MIDPATLNENGLTAEQEKSVQEAYMFTDKAEYTEEDIALAREMFDTPEKFQLLRKILKVFTPEERGLAFKTPQALVEADPKEVQVYGVASAIDALADEKVRKALLGFYVLIRGHVQQDMSEGLKKQNDDDIAEAQRTEEFNAEQEEKNRPVGENL